MFNNFANLLYLIIFSFSKSGGGPYSCTREVSIKVKHGNRSATVVLKQNLKVEVNGVLIQSFPMPILSDYMIISLPSSTKVSVITKSGFRILWDGRINVDIDAISLYKGKINGLCEKNKSKRRKRYTNIDTQAWIASMARESCIGDSCNTIDKVVNYQDQCASNMEAKKRAELHCARLMDNTFKVCHRTLSPQIYYHDCVMDVCACERGIDSCKCDVFTAYANECSRRGIVVKNWRQSIRECGWYFS